MKTSICAMLAAAGLVQGVAQAQAPAQIYPNRFLKFIVTYPPGGSSDVMARIIGKELTDAWGQQVIIDSKPGADGAIGMEYAKGQPADGYTFLLGNFGPVVAKPLLSKVNYDWQRDFTPVGLITQSANILVVPVGTPWKSTKDLIAAAKAQPGILTFGTSGPGSMSHLAGEMFKRLAGVDLIAVSYKGNALAITDLMGGHVQVMFSNTINAMPHVKSKRLRALAITTPQRSLRYPDFPTVAESGLAGYESDVWYGVLAPGQTPAEIVGRLNREIVGILKTADMKEKLATQGAEAAGSTPEAFAALIRNEITKWGRVTAALKLQMD